MPRDNRPVEIAEQSEPSGQDGSHAPSQVSSGKGERSTTRRRQQGEGSQAARTEAASPAPAPAPRVPRLLQRYRDEIVPTMIKEFGYAVPLQVPRLKKVVINVGLGEAIQNPNTLETVTQMLATIGGQRPVITKARRSIAGFKLRAGMRIGAMVTLRSHRMYDFVDRLLNAALPRIRDFRGVPPSSFDGRGNYSLGIREQVIFPEIEYSRIDRIRSFQVSFVTSAMSDGEASRLLELLGMPFARAQEDGR